MLLEPIAFVFCIHPGGWGRVCRYAARGLLLADAAETNCRPFSFSSPWRVGPLRIHPASGPCLHARCAGFLLHGGILVRVPPRDPPADPRWLAPSWGSGHQGGLVPFGFYEPPLGPPSVSGLGHGHGGTQLQELQELQSGKTTGMLFDLLPAVVLARRPRIGAAPLCRSPRLALRTNCLPRADSPCLSWFCSFVCLVSFVVNPAALAALA